MEYRMQSKRVLILTRLMGQGGTENVILDISSALIETGYTVVVCSSGGVNVTKLKEMGIKHIIIPDIGSKNIISVIRAFWIVKRIIKSEKIDIIHSHHRMAALIARLCSNSKIKTVITAHNTFSNGKILTKFGYSRSQIIAVGQAVKENLVGVFGISPTRIEVVPNGVHKFRVGDQKPVPELEKLRKSGSIIIGNVGRLAPQKGMSYFLKSIPIVLKKIPSANFIIVGDGEQKRQLEELVRDERISDHVLFLGYRNDIQNILSQVDFLVLSSLWEGFPLTPIEAFSVSKPVVATNVDGTPEIVKNGINGLLVTPKNVLELADAEIKMAMAPELRESFSKNAISDYRRLYSLQAMQKKYLHIYRRL